jgi:hypothetical protein
MKATLVRAGVTGIVGLIALALAFDAAAARPPSDPERAAITQALPAWFRNYPVGCVWLIIRVSKNGRYAFVAEGVNNPLRAPCVKYAFNGFWVLKHQVARRWKVIFNGSAGLPCSLGVPGDLRVPGGCTRGP